MKTQSLFCTLLFLLSVTSSFAQHTISGQEENYLSVMTPLCQTEKYIWAKSNLGLLRINMQSGKIWLFTKSNSLLPSNDVTSVVSLRDGQTYISTTNGIALWDNYGMLLLDTENTALPENHITEMWLDQHENLYVRTKNYGLFKGIGHCIKLFKLKKVADPNQGVVNFTTPTWGINDPLASNQNGYLIIKR